MDDGDDDKEWHKNLKFSLKWQRTGLQDSRPVWQWDCAMMTKCCSPAKHRRRRQIEYSSHWHRKCQSEPHNSLCQNTQPPTIQQLKPEVSISEWVRKTTLTSKADDGLSTSRTPVTYCCKAVQQTTNLQLVAEHSAELCENKSCASSVWETINIISDASLPRRPVVRAERADLSV